MAGGGDLWREAVCSVARCRLSALPTCPQGQRTRHMEGFILSPTLQWGLTKLLVLAKWVSDESNNWRILGGNIVLPVTECLGPTFHL